MKENTNILVRAMCNLSFLFSSKLFLYTFVFFIQLFLRSKEIQLCIYNHSSYPFPGKYKADFKSEP